MERVFHSPVSHDPFLQPGYGQQGYGQSGYGMQPSPYGGYTQGLPPQGMTTYGANGVQPYRFAGKTDSTSHGSPARKFPARILAKGDLDIIGVDYELAYGTPFLPGWVLNWTNQFSYRNWNSVGGDIRQPRDLYRFGIDLELETPQAGPFSISLGITPLGSIRTSMSMSGTKVFSSMGRGIMFLQLDQYWTLGLEHNTGIEFVIG
ncbi:MAG: hypothetical protein U0936_01525 [Planctomycetaceae bacterium]